MKIKFFNLIIILFTIIGYSQNSGKVFYSVLLSEDVNPIKDAEIEEIRAVAKKQTFSLQFNKDKSKFTAIDNIGVNSFYSKMAYISYTCGYDFYCDNKSKIQLFKKQSNTLITSKTKEFSWSITSETKFIDKYLCYKAIYKIDYLAGDNKLKTRFITAWFAPSLPFPYGPKEYYGLPGLILELQEYDTVFLATKIELSDQILEISFPQGKTITEEEYIKRISSY